MSPWTALNLKKKERTSRVPWEALVRQKTVQVAPHCPPTNLDINTLRTSRVPWAGLGAPTYTRIPKTRARSAEKICQIIQGPLAWARCGHLDNNSKAKARSAENFFAQSSLAWANRCHLNKNSKIRARNAEKILGNIKGTLGLVRSAHLRKEPQNQSAKR